MEQANWTSKLKKKYKTYFDPSLCITHNTTQRIYLANLNSFECLDKLFEKSLIKIPGFKFNPNPKRKLIELKVKK